MSKEIDLDKPLSDEDRAWLQDHSHLDVIIENDRKFKEVDDMGYTNIPPVGAPPSWTPGSEPTVKYAHRPFDPPITGVFANDVVVPGMATAEAETEEVEDDLDEWTVDELKDELRARELSTSGNKADLIERIREAD